MSLKYDARNLQGVVAVKLASNLEHPLFAGLKKRFQAWKKDGDDTEDSEANSAEACWALNNAVAAQLGDNILAGYRGAAPGDSTLNNEP